MKPRTKKTAEAIRGELAGAEFQTFALEYEEDRKARLGTEADQPHRIKYRPLTRS